MRKNIVISSETDKKVKEVSKKQGINQSQLIEISVIYYLDHLKLRKKK